MISQMITLPSRYDQITTIRILIPAKGEEFRSSSDSILRQGDKSPIGNRNCFHMKAEWNIIPLLPSYDVKPFTSPSHYYLRWTAVGLSFGRWTALLANLPRTRSYVHDYGSHTEERYITVSKMEPGYCEVLEEVYDFDNKTHERNYSLVRSFTITTSSFPSTVCSVVSHSIEFAGGVWREWSQNESYYSRFYTVSLDPFSYDARALWRAHGGEFLWRTRNLIQLKEWGELANDCVVNGDKAYQTNSAQYLLELGQLSTLLQPYLQLIRSGMSAKAAASAWLSYYYGARLTAEDTYAQISGIIRRSRRKIMAYDTLRSRDTATAVMSNGTSITGYRSLTTYYHTHTEWILDTWRALRRYGLNPSLSLAWDLVPLSFVVDWVAPIGDALKHFDGRTFQQSLSIIESLLTTKYVQTSSAEQMGFLGRQGSVTLTVYDRQITPKSMPRSVFTFEPVSFSGMKALNGTALVVQRRP